MLNELELDKDGLRKVLSAMYGLRATALTFVPQGEVTYGYRADCQDGSRYFVKVYNDSRASRRSAARLPYTLAINRALHDRGILPHVPYPVRARNGWLRGGFAGHPLVVYPFIEGVNPSDEVFHSAPMLGQLAEVVVRLHQATAQLDMPLPQEDFTADFEADLLACLDALHQVDEGSTPGQQELAALILPREQGVRDRLARLYELGAWAKALAPEMVLCHTDIHRFNVLVDAAGELHLLDWETALVAPREHDLKMMGGPSMEAFLAHYVELAGCVHLEPDLFGYYFHHRILEDLTDRMYRILHENRSDEQDQTDLQDIREDCLQWWDDLEAGSALRRILAQYGA